MAQERDAVAHRQEPGTDDRRPGGPVAQFVDQARLESAAKPDMGRVGHGTATHFPRKLPVIASDDRAGSARPLPDGQDRVRVADVGSRVGPVPVETVSGSRMLGPMRELLVRVVHAGLEHHDDVATKGTPIGTDRLRGIKADQDRIVDDVPLPPAPGHRPPVTHQEPVAGVQGLGRVWLCRRAVERDRLAAPVHHEEQEVAVPAHRVDGLQETERGGEVHHAGGIAGRVVKTRNHGIRSVKGIDGKVQAARDLLVGTGRSK